MAGPRLGRDARIYYHTSAFTAAGLTVVAHTQDITITDEAAVVTAKAADLEYDVHGQGSKDFGVEFSILREGTDETSFAALRAAYDAQTMLWFAVLPAAKTETAGMGMLFVGKVMKFNEDHPMGDAVAATVLLKNGDMTIMPTWTATPLA
jgi:hypothetical protein